MKLPDSDRLNDVLSVIPKWAMRIALITVGLSSIVVIFMAFGYFHGWVLGGNLAILLMSAIAVIKLEPHHQKLYCRYWFTIRNPAEEDVFAINAECDRFGKVCRITSQWDVGDAGQPIWALRVGVVHMEWFVYLKMKYQR